MNRDDQVFWDRIADMPWVEAELECVKRREELTQQRHDLEAEVLSQTHRQRRDLAKLNAKEIDGQLTLLNERIKWLRKVQARVSWAEACRAVLDHETYTEVRVRMALLEQEAVAQCPAPLIPYHHHARR